MASNSSRSSRSSSCGERLTPDQNPLFWLIVNSICCAYSLQLLLVIFFNAQYMNDVDDDGDIVDDNNPNDSSSPSRSSSNGMAFAQQTYLLYDLTTTIVWCTEASLNTFFRGNSSSTADHNGGDDSGGGVSLVVSIVTSQQFSNYVEWILALYFVSDSLNEVYKWKFKSQETEVMTIAVILTFVGYLYKVIQEYPIIHKRYMLGYQQLSLQEDVDDEEEV